VQYQQTHEIFPFRHGQVSSLVKIFIASLFEQARSLRFNSWVQLSLLKPGAFASRATYSKGMTVISDLDVSGVFYACQN
jgi:hypothetical protein